MFTVKQNINKLSPYLLGTEPIHWLIKNRIEPFDRLKYDLGVVVVLER